jgi:glycosyltransferase involved in cell wall biosynthesis
MHKTSIIVPVYNAVPWLDEALGSIDYGNTIIVDDGSTDGSGDICEKYAPTIHTKHLGVAAARNRGLQAAKTEFIAFCDADDFYEPGMLKRMESEMPGHDMVIGGFRKFGAFEQTMCEARAGSRTKEYVAKYALKNLLNPRQQQLLSGCWAKLYRHDLVSEFPDMTTAEDLVFNFDYMARCESIRFLNSVVYNVRKHTNGSLTTTFDEDNRRGLFQVIGGLRKVKAFIEPYKLVTDAELEDAVDNSAIYHTLMYFTRICGFDPKKAFLEMYP